MSRGLPGWAILGGGTAVAAAAFFGSAHVTHWMMDLRHPEVTQHRRGRRAGNGRHGQAPGSTAGTEARRRRTAVITGHSQAPHSTTVTQVPAAPRGERAKPGDVLCPATTSSAGTPGEVPHSCVNE